MSKNSVSVALEEYIHEMAKKKAKKERRSLSNYVETILVEDLEKDDDFSDVTERHRENL
jgi:predicted HicB family RNase H-like nuclease